MTHIMIDLETMSTHTNAAITEIGACSFLLDGKSHQDTFSTGVLLSDNRANGRHISSDTIAWWLQQDTDARANYIATQAQGIELIQALIDLESFIISQGKIDGVWSNGSTFDLTILKSAYEHFGMKTPWAYRLERDVRTLEMLAPEAYRPKPTVAHRALDDAISQSEWVQNMYRAIKR